MSPHTQLVNIETDLAAARKKVYKAAAVASISLAVIVLLIVVNLTNGLRMSPYLYFLPLGVMGWAVFNMAHEKTAVDLLKIQRENIKQSG